MYDQQIKTFRSKVQINIPCTRDSTFFDWLEALVSLACCQILTEDLNINVSSEICFSLFEERWDEK